MQEDRIWILIAKKLCDEASDEELAELAELLKKGRAAGFSEEMMDRLWKVPLQSLPDNKAENSEVWSRVGKYIEQRRVSERRLAGGLKKLLLAAGLTLFIGATLLLLYRWKQRESDRLADAVPFRINRIATRPHAKSKIELPDGTQVWLNENTQMIYDSKDFGVYNREVTLRGEAFFDVTKSAGMPFIIHAGRVNIKVLGTSFNVKAYPRDKNVEAALIRGKIAVYFSDSSAEEVILEPDEKIVVPLEGLCELKTRPRYSVEAVKKDISGNIPETSWMQGKLVFDDEAFGMLAEKMEAWYGVEFSFANDSLRNLHFSGVIDGETLAQALGAMQLSRHFTFRVEGNNVFIGD